MALNLDQPFSWTHVLAARTPSDTDRLAMLHDLQGNILKGHGRHHTVNLFLTFDTRRRDAVKAFLADFGDHDVTTALRQLLDAQVFKATRDPRGDFAAVLLSATGYRALGVPEHLIPPDEAFLAGMAGRRQELNDGPRSDREPAFRGAPLHAMLLLASDGREDDDLAPIHALQQRVEARLEATGAIKVVGREIGLARFNRAGAGIEHFGYVDGRSQPLMLQEDIDQEFPGGVPAGAWDPTVPPAQVLVRDPGGDLAVSHGAYFVFRKLEQDVKALKQAEVALSQALGDNGALAGAAVVGRWRNGTALMDTPPGHDTRMQPDLAEDNGIPNSFGYGAADSHLTCPFASHVRKLNPRRDDAQRHLMARRGIPYGDRSDDPNDDAIDDKPSSGVGLLFRAYQSSLVDQFEFTQKQWANNAGFDFTAAEQPVGIDPIVGQPPHGTGRDTLDKQVFLERIGTSGARSHLSGFVTMKGGEYFFAPAVSVLRRLA